MRLSAKIIKNVANVNNWEYANQAHVQENQANDIYIQIVDLDKTPAVESSAAHPDFPLRYLSQATVLAVQATFPFIDDAEEFSIAGTQPFSDDKSIWKFTLTSAQFPNSGSFTVKITEDGVDRYFLVKDSIRADLLNDGGC